MVSEALSIANYWMELSKIGHVSGMKDFGAILSISLLLIGPCTIVIPTLRRVCAKYQRRYRLRGCFRELQT